MQIDFSFSFQILDILNIATILIRITESEFNPIFFEHVLDYTLYFTVLVQV